MGADNSSSGIVAQMHNAAGTITKTEFLVNTYTSDAQTNPHVASLSDGGFVIAWQSPDQSSDIDLGIFAQRFNSSGTKSEAKSMSILL